MIIGFSGKIGSGKTRISNKLEEVGYTRKSFATSLRRVVGILGGFDWEKSKTPQEKAILVDGWNISRGEMLQQVGCTMRQLNPDVWVNSLLNEYESNMLWVIDDVRFPNEVLSIEALGGVVIRLNDVCTDTTRDLNHISETALDNWNFKYRIDNTELTTIENFNIVMDIIKSL